MIDSKVWTGLCLLAIEAPLLPAWEILIYLFTAAKAPWNWPQNLPRRGFRAYPFFIDVFKKIAAKVWRIVNKFSQISWNYDHLAIILVKISEILQNPGRAVNTHWIAEVALNFATMVQRVEHKKSRNGRSLQDSVDLEKCWKMLIAEIGVDTDDPRWERASESVYYF